MIVVSLLITTNCSTVWLFYSRAGFLAVSLFLWILNIKKRFGGCISLVSVLKIPKQLMVKSWVYSVLLIAQQKLIRKYVWPWKPALIRGLTVTILLAFKKVFLIWFLTFRVGLYLRYLMRWTYGLTLHTNRDKSCEVYQILARNSIVSRRFLEILRYVTIIGLQYSDNHHLSTFTNLTAVEL